MTPPDSQGNPRRDQRRLEESAEERLGVLSRRWALHIVVLLADGPMRFNDLNRGISRVSRRMVNERLHELVEAGVIERVVDPGPPLSTTYQLTPFMERYRALWTGLGEWAIDREYLSAAS